jgi:hypothetical protein
VKLIQDSSFSHIFPSDVISVLPNTILIAFLDTHACYMARPSHLPSCNSTYPSKILSQLLPTSNPHNPYPYDTTWTSTHLPSSQPISLRSWVNFYPPPILTTHIPTILSQLLPNSHPHNPYPYDPESTSTHLPILTTHIPTILPPTFHTYDPYPYDPESTSTHHPS